MSDPDEHDASLTHREAFLAMTEFLWKYARRAGDDLFTLLGDIEIEADGEPGDPAAWADWMECVDHVTAGLPPRREHPSQLEES